MEGKYILKTLLFWINVIAVFGLLLSTLSGWVDPNYFLFPAFFGLAFLPLLVLNVLFLLFWLLTRSKKVWASALIIVLSFPTIQRHFQLPPLSGQQQGSFDVLSFNVRLFDLYNWSENRQTRNRILDYIRSTDAEIICLQEFFNSDDPRYFNTLDTLREVQKAKNYHEEFTAILHDGLSKFGIATITSYPIVHRGRIPLDTKSGHNIAIYSDLLIGEDTVRVFNLHLASVHLSAMEKDISEHIERNDQQKQWNDLKTLIRKLAGGFKRRSDQAEIIAGYIRESPHPVIVCGDFNDTPASYCYSLLSDDLEDSFCEKGSGLGTSYIGFFPSLRIDYLLHSEALELHSFSTEPVKLSDHRPLLGSFTLQQEEP